MKKILVVGISVIDHITLLNALPENLETTIALNANEYIGGKGLNQATTISRLNGDVKFLTSLGNDYEGKKIKKHLIKNHVESQIISDPSSKTGHSYINADVNGNYTIVVCNKNSQIDLSAFKKLGLNLGEFDIVIMQWELPTPLIEYISKEVKKSNAMLFVNASPFIQETNLITQDVDFLFCNFAELEKISMMKIENEIDLEKAFGILTYKRITKHFIVFGLTHIYHFHQGKLNKFKKYVVNPRNNVGVSDCFIGAFAVAISEEHAISESIEFAMASSAIASLKNSVSEELPSRNDVEVFIRNINH